METPELKTYQDFLRLAYNEEEPSCDPYGPAGLANPFQFAEYCNKIAGQEVLVLFDSDSVYIYSGSTKGLSSSCKFGLPTTVKVLHVMLESV